MKFIDSIGLKYFYDKLADKFVKKTDKISKDSTDTYGVTSYDDLYNMFAAIGSENIPAILATNVENVTDSSNITDVIQAFYTSLFDNESEKSCVLQVAKMNGNAITITNNGILVTDCNGNLSKSTQVFAANGTLFDTTTKLDTTGGKVKGNLYALPDNCTDIADFTDAEKSLLTNNTVQKNILELNKTKTFVDSIKLSNNSIKLKNKANLVGYVEGEYKGTIQSNSLPEMNSVQLEEMCGEILQVKVNGVNNGRYLLSYIEEK